MNEQAAYWDNVYQHIGSKRQSPFTQAKHDCILAALPEDAVSILDAGCGGGALLAALKQLGRGSIEGMDLSPEGVNFVRDELGVAARVGSVLDMNEYDDNSFDLVICSEVTEHLHDDELPVCYKELCRVAKKYVLVTNPYNEDLRYHQILCFHCHSSFHAAGHIQRVDEEFQRRYFGPYSNETAFHYSGRREKRYASYAAFVRRCGRNVLFREGMTCSQCQRLIEKRPWPVWLRGVGKAYQSWQTILLRLGAYEPANLITLATLPQ